MKITFLLPLLAGVLAAPALAQNQDLGDPPADLLGDGGAVEDIAIEGEDDGPLRGTVTDESDCAIRQSHVEVKQNIPAVFWRVSELILKTLAQYMTLC